MENIRFLFDAFVYGLIGILIFFIVIIVWFSIDFFKNLKIIEGTIAKNKIRTFIFLQSLFGIILILFVILFNIMGEIEQILMKF